MDDILASIRRILTEDEAGQGHMAPPETMDDAGELTLDASMRIDPPIADLPDRAAHPATPIEDAVADEPAVPRASQPLQPIAPLADAPAPMPAAPAPAALAVMPEPPPLVAEDAAAQSQAAIASLIDTLQRERLTAVSSRGPTLEDLVRVEIRPVLKTWLDTHLPPLVERVVRAEIERLTGRGMI